jgi:hypothetical protein
MRFQVNVNIVGWVTVQRCTETLLIKMMADETDAAAQNK